MAGAMGRSQAMSKASFFAALENLDDSDDEPQEGLSFQNLLTASRPFLDIASQTATTSIASANPPCLTRANTEPASSGKTSEDCTEIQRDEYYLLNKPTGQKLRTVKRSNTTGTMPGTQVKGSSTTKRKADALKSIPEERQLFKGLVFCMKTHTFFIKPATNIRTSLYPERRHRSRSPTTYPTGPRIRCTVDSTMGNPYNSCRRREKTNLPKSDRLP
jgi:hypothetical protein